MLAERENFLCGERSRAFLIPWATKCNLWQSWDLRKQTVLNFINYLKFFREFRGYNYYGIDIYYWQLLIILQPAGIKSKKISPMSQAIVNLTESTL